MTLFNEEETEFELTSIEQFTTRYLEAITEELLSLFWGKSPLQLKQIVEETIPIDKDIEFYTGVKFGLLLSVVTLLESINESLNCSPSIIKGMFIIKKMIKVIDD
jgi:hypothetical protein